MNNTEMRRFQLQRSEDISGMSGVGVVAEGVEFSDGTVVMKWRSIYSSTVIYPNIKDMEHIHSHEGRTTIQWID